ncbi:MAG TPA: hypothetical protein DDW52_23880 [Planctomycetaceae bacterium]|nr:hypothetical protein [Planctomycetaceae bacterium]
MADHKFHLVLIRVCLGACLLSAACWAQEPSSQQASSESSDHDKSSVSGDRLFTLEVLPILKEKCFGCHGTDKNDLRGDYDLMTREAMIAGGESGEVALVPGNADESVVYQAVMWDGYEMPPKENDRLTPEQTELIKKWIDAGAPWPGKERQEEIQREQWQIRETEDGVIIDTVGGLADDWTYRRYASEDLWAFQPVGTPKPPTEGHPIDAFLGQEIDEAGLKQSPPADPETLLRRIVLDLTGLPPTAEQREAFLTAAAQDESAAVDALVDQLLESEHYGERWAQHWLDVVRYADTGGFSNDYERSNAWRYRDYVIRAMNDDKPFNEFILEQIAGDELRPDDPEALVATGMLRMGPWGTAMIPQEEARQIYLDDLVHNVGQAFLSMPMRCCKCHDHKFDPIPTRDYYAMYAAFATTQPAEIDVPFLEEENLALFEPKRKLAKELLDYAQAELKRVNDKQEAAAKKWYAENDLPYKNEKDRQNDPEDQKPPRHVGLTPEEKGIKKVREQDVWIWQRRLERYQPMAQAVYNGQDDWKNARKLRKAKNINQDWRPENFILTGGALEAKGAAVEPGVLSAVALNMPSRTETKSDKPWKITDELSGRRSELARWIASDDNPITARSIVNRVWQHHFSVGLVKTANNFGAKGAKPTHPELLDWLTNRFIEGGWKIKPLHRLIMSSQAYQRSSRPVDMDATAEIDPDNKLLSYFPVRRLSAEELRDSMLAISGELNPELGGVPIMPEINMEVALQPRMIQFSIAPAHQPSRTPQERNRRSIYAYRVRGQADPFLEILNLPNPNESCQMRNSMAVTPQAFTLLNSDVMTDRSIAIALRLVRDGASQNDEIVASAFESILGRQPTEPELLNMSDYLNEMRDYHRANPPEAVEYPTTVTRSLVEEFTGEPFEFVELLNVYNDYVPDAKPWTVSAETRAIADVCLILLNTNEFMYVY